MPVYNISALADRTRYLMNTQGMSQQEAEQKVFDDAGLQEGANSMPSNVYDAYMSLVNNQNASSDYARNDNENLINRNETATNDTFDISTASE